LLKETQSLFESTLLRSTYKAEIQSKVEEFPFNLPHNTAGAAMILQIRTEE